MVETDPEPAIDERQPELDLSESTAEVSDETSEPEAEAVASVEPDPTPAVEQQSPAQPEPEPPGFVPDEPEPAPVFELPAATFEPEPELEAQPEPEPEPEPEPQREESVEIPADPTPEPELAGGVDAQERERQTKPSPEPTWDQERYTADIGEPDWWAPEQSGSPRVDAASGELAGDEPKPSAPTSDPAAAARLPDAREEQGNASAAARPVDATPIGETEPRTAPRAAFLGEETMLWFGRRPIRLDSTDAPSDDAAAEMEVASAGRRPPMPPRPTTGLPGGQELDEALASFDAPVPDDSTSREAALPRVPPMPRSESASSPPPTSDVRSRAYRRLRRIFPG